ncbi:MAG: acyl-CoA dehydrogenase family protein [Gammaproteobacteria bacterium]
MTTAVPANAELMARIHEIGPLLRDNAVQADRERRVPDTSVEALKSIGAFGINVPRRYGGLEAGARAMVEAAAAIGYYCTNAGWISVISSVSSLLPARFPASLYERMYVDQRPVPMASVIVSPGAEAVRDGEGYRVSGEWPFASNIWHAEWALGVVAIRDGDATAARPGFAFLQREQYVVKDVWHTIGMRGTGSNVFVARDAWVPMDQVVDAEVVLGTAFEAAPAASFSQRLPPVSVFGTTIAAPPLGAAKAALALTVDAAAKRPITYSNYQVQSRSGAFVQGVGAVRAKIDTAEMCLLRAADTIDIAAQGTTPLSGELRARIRNDIGHATYNLGEAMNDIAWLHGTALFAEASTLGRLWRDVHTGIRHALTAAPLNYEIGGAAALGVEAPARLV